MFPSELVVVEGAADDDEGVVPTVETPAEVAKFKLDADFVVVGFGTLALLLLDAAITTLVVAVAVAVEADVEVVVTVVAMVMPVREAAMSVEVATVVVRGAPPGAISIASNVGDETVAGSTHFPPKSPTRPSAQQK